MVACEGYCSRPVPVVVPWDCLEATNVPDTAKIRDEGRYPQPISVESSQDDMSFDVEGFVHRLVDDDPPPCRDHLVWQAPTTALGAGLFLQPTHAQQTEDWPPISVGNMWNAPRNVVPITSGCGGNTTGGSVQVPLPKGKVSPIPFTPRKLPYASASGSVHFDYVDEAVGVDIGVSVCASAASVSAAGNPMDSQQPAAVSRVGGNPRSSRRLSPTEGLGTDYDDEMHTFLRGQERAVLVGPGYLAGPGRPGLVTPVTRAALVDWVAGVHAAAPAASGISAPLSLETLFLSVNLLDRFLSTADGARAAWTGQGALRMAAAAALSLASKYEDTEQATLRGLASVISGVGGANANSGAAAVATPDTEGIRRELEAMELRVCIALDFRLTVPTTLSFLGVFLRRAGTLGFLRGATATRVEAAATQLLRRMLRDASSLTHPPSALAAAALCWACCEHHTEVPVPAPGVGEATAFAADYDPSGPVFEAVTSYRVETLCRCLRDIVRVRASRLPAVSGMVLGHGWPSPPTQPHQPFLFHHGGGGGLTGVGVVGHQGIAAL
ncbi:unnamed protein product [Discosporangium mesarthrocarpum]